MPPKKLYLDFKIIDVKISRKDSRFTRCKVSSSVHLWLILWRAYETMQEHARLHIDTLGIGFSDFAVLELLLHKGPMPVNRIGEKIGLTSGSITVAVDRLEKKQLAERKNDPGDRRARVVHL